MSQPVMLKKLKLNGSIMTYKTFWTNAKKKKKVLFIIENWNAKGESQKIPGVTGKFGLGVKYKAGQSLTVFKQVVSRCCTLFFI